MNFHDIIDSLRSIYLSNFTARLIRFIYAESLEAELFSTKLEGAEQKDEMPVFDGIANISFLAILISNYKFFSYST